MITLTISKALIWAVILIVLGLLVIWQKWRQEMPMCADKHEVTRCYLSAEFYIVTWILLILCIWGWVA